MTAAASAHRSAREPGLELRPGTVRKARQTAGLSLRELAQGDISSAALSLIETGQTRPTLATLELIAGRTGKPLKYFLSPASEELVRRLKREAHEESVLVVVEELIITDRFAEALAAAEAALTERRSPAGRARLDLLMAQAQLRLGEFELAGGHLARARNFFKRSGDRLMLAETLDWEAATRLHLQQSDALTFAEQALAACRALEPVPQQLEARILTRIGGIYAGEQRWEDARRAFEAALTVGGSLRDLNRLAGTYSDLASVYRELHDLPSAARFASKSVTIHEVLRDRHSIARAENNLALVLIELGRPDEAEAHLRRALVICEEVGLEHGSAHVLLSLAELDLKRGQLDKAAEEVEEGLQIAGRLREPATIAEARRFRALISQARGDGNTADAEFAAAFKILSDAGLQSRLGPLHTAYARLLSERGDTEEALRHMMLAVEGPATTWHKGDLIAQSELPA